VTRASSHTSRDDGKRPAASPTGTRLRSREFVPPMIDDPYVNEWARLWVVARRMGVALSDNDLWIAATASVRERTLVTCDRDHVRIAPELGAEVLYLAPPV
jgi:predicted nucleic acid-binding protein